MEIDNLMAMRPYPCGNENRIEVGVGGKKKMKPWKEREFLYNLF
jgi:hypothetical protein